MSQAPNRFRSNLRDLKFALFEQFHVDETLLGKGAYASWDRDAVEMVLAEADKLAKNVLGPLNPVGDRVGCKLENGKVTTPPGFQEAWKKLYEAGFKTLAVAEEHGGQAAPMSIFMAVEEILVGANAAFGMYSGLAHNAAELIAAFGTTEQKEKYVDKMLNGVWAGTMCLTEPQAGSDVGSASTSAKRLADGTYSIKGTKIFISGGDHDLTENIVHLVLARVEGAPAGTKGLSLFIVPKLRVDGKSNDVITASLEHKMGINGSSTAVLQFGENDGCIGEVMGGVENAGMAQMFKMMNGARIGVGLQGLAVASTAYLNALEYAKERKQGSHITKWKDASAPRVAILEHPDVRRMLLDMKSRVEAIRALLVKLCAHADLGNLIGGTDDDKANYHRGQVDLLVPILKSYASDQAFRVAETAIQVFGGAGFLKDHPVEQYARDAKIFSIYEGTNHIQAMDLVGRKLGQHAGANFGAFLKDVGTFVAKHGAHPALGADVKQLGRAAEAVATTAQKFLGWFAGGDMPMVPLAANRFLEMMAELVSAWLLLDAAVIAAEKGGDDAFYQGKVASAQYYARNVLPGVFSKADILAREDRTPVTIPDAAF